jgi:hypothetical protein
MGTRDFAITSNEDGSASEEVKSKEASECNREEVGLSGGEGNEGQRTTKSISL